MKTTILCIILLAGLRFSMNLTAQESVFSTGIVNADKLPPMEIVISEERLVEAFSDYHELITEEYTYDGAEAGTHSTFMYRDRKISDTRKLFTRYLENDLLTPGKEPTGLIEMDLVYYNRTERFTAGSFLNVFSFGITALLGVPGKKDQTLVEVELGIFDRNGQLIKKYFAPGKKNTYHSLYARKIDEREANLEALKKALEVINEMVMTEKEDIIRLL